MHQNTIELSQYFLQTSLLLDTPFSLSTLDITQTSKFIWCQLKWLKKRRRTICLDTYTDPKLLQCFHSYCRPREKQARKTWLTCRQVTAIPDRGVAGLQSAFHINHLLEIRESLRNRAATPEGEAIKKVNHCPSSP